MYTYVRYTETDRDMDIQREMWIELGINRKRGPERGNEMQGYVDRGRERQKPRETPRERESESECVCVSVCVCVCVYVSETQ